MQVGKLFVADEILQMFYISFRVGKKILCSTNCCITNARTAQSWQAIKKVSVYLHILLQFIINISCLLEFENLTVKLSCLAM